MILIEQTVQAAEEGNVIINLEIEMVEVWKEGLIWGVFSYWE